MMLTLVLASVNDSQRCGLQHGEVESPRDLNKATMMRQSLKIQKWCGTLTSGKTLWLFVAICELFVTICNYMPLYTAIAALITTYNTYSHIALIGTPAFIMAVIVLYSCI